MFACLHVPDFPVQAALLAEPGEGRESLWRLPVAVLDGPSNLLKVFALNDAARDAGIKIGMTKPQAEICGTVVLRQRASEWEDAAQDALLECAADFSPRIESTASGTVVLDISGTEKLLGAPQKLACKIAVRAKQAGFHLRIAIASNPDTALLAAKGFRGITIIPEGEEAKALASLYVGNLPLTPELAEILEAWGVRTFKALAALPTIALTERLGQEGLKLQQLAQGRANRPLLPVEASTEFIESYEFDDPVETFESLEFVLNRLLQQVFERLIAHSLATNEIQLTLDFEVRQIQSESEGEQFTHNWKLPVPTQDRKLPFTLIRLDLERNTFSAPIKKLTIQAMPVRPRASQGNLFAPPSPEAGQMEITLARIRGIVGSKDPEGVSNIGAAALVDTHQRGSFSVQQFSTESKPADPPPISTACALQAFRPPLETSVELTGQTPHQVRLYKKYRRVLAASGPWRSSGSWWNRKIWWREEWDVALKTFEGIGYCRIYLDRLRKQWFVEGVFD
jgi:protein ImuB